MPDFTNVYFNMSTGEGDLRGPWNNEPTFEYREAEPAVDGGDGLAIVGIDKKDLELVNRASMRLKSDPKSDPVTGAMLGMDNGTQGLSGNGYSAAAMGPKAAKMEAKSQKTSPSGKHS
jgi:Mn-containing catalase